jgi:hypothetical protein
MFMNNRLKDYFIILMVMTMMAFAQETTFQLNSIYYTKCQKTYQDTYDKCCKYNRDGFVNEYQWEGVIYCNASGDCIQELKDIAISRNTTPRYGILSTPRYWMYGCAWESLINKQ